MTITNHPFTAAWAWHDIPGDSLAREAELRGVEELFLHVPARMDELPERAAQISQVVRAAKAAGLRVAALGGDPAWPQDPGNVIRRWLIPALATADFDAVHLDVEPRISPRCPRSDLSAALLRLAQEVKAASPLPLELDIRFWYHRIPAGRSDLTSALLDVADGVTVMSYRRRTRGPDGSVGLSAPAAQRAQAAGRRFRVGIETKDR